MIKTKSLWAIAVFSALLTGCQQTNNIANRVPAVAESDNSAKPLESAKTSKKDKYVVSTAFKAKRDELLLKLVDRLMAQCVKGDGEEEMKACFHERMLVGFDNDGNAKKHCPQQDDIGDDLKCIVIGEMGYQLASKVGKDAVVSFDWADPENSTDDMSKQLVLQQIRNCLNNGSASDPFDCVVGGMAQVLDLSSSDLDPCSQYKDDDYKFGHCVGEAFSYKYLSAGIARM